MKRSTRVRRPIRLLFQMGEGLHSIRWCTAMRERGFDVHFLHRQAYAIPGVTMHRLEPLAPRRRASTRAEARQVETAKKFGPVHDAAALIARLADYRRLLRLIKPDLFHVTLGVHGYWAALTGFSPLVVSILGADLYDDSRMDFKEHRVALHLFRRAALVTADTPHAAAVLAGWGCPVSTFREVHWGVDGAFFGNAPPAPALARLPRPLFFCNRSAVPNSCLDVVLRAFALVRKRRRCSLVLGGRIALEETAASLRSFVAEHRLPDVHFIRDVPHAELPGYYAAAAAFLSVPYSDGTSVSVLEGMAAGLPLILSDIPANRALVARGAHAALVPVMDAEALAAAMDRALSPSPRRSSENRRAARRYAAIRQMDRMAELYRRLVAHPRPSHR